MTTEANSLLKGNVFSKESKGELDEKLCTGPQEEIWGGAAEVEKNHTNNLHYLYGPGLDLTLSDF